MLKPRYVAGLFILWALIYVGSAGYPPALLDDADTVHAEVAREMVTTGDWVTLHANGIRYLEKAPLMYWSVALSYKILGVSEFATRLPIAIATLCLILVVLLIASHAFGRKAGFYSALVLLCCIGIFLFTRVLWPDVILTLFVSSAFYCFLRAVDEPRANAGFVYGMYASAALGVLTKGLIGAAFPAMIIGAYLLATRRLHLIRHFRLVTGTLLFLAIAAPWHIAAGLANSGSLMNGTPSPTQGRGFFWFYFVNEHFLRYIGKRYPQDYDTVPLALFIGLHLVWLFPWSAFAPLAFRDIPRRLKNLDPERSITLFVWIWAALIVLFFCFSTTQEYYTMPAYPAFAILTGKAISRAELEWGQRKQRRLMIGLHGVLAALGVVVLTIGLVAFVKTRAIPVAGDISSTLTRNPEAYALSLGHVLDLTPQSFASLRWPVLGTALAFGLGTVIAIICRLRSRHTAAAWALALMMAGFFYCARLSLGQFAPYLSSRALAAVISREYEDGEMIVINGEYESGSSINFYTRRQVYLLNGRSANLEYGSYFKDAPQIFLTFDDLSRIWKESRRVYLVSDELESKRLMDQLGVQSAHLLAESGGKVLLSNQ